MGRTRELESFFSALRNDLRTGDAFAFYGRLSPDTHQWLLDIRRAAESDPRPVLAERPFFEIVTVLAIRVEKREHPEFQTDPVSLVRKVVVSAAPIRNSFLSEATGAPHLQGDGAVVGLAKAPNVPVFFFEYGSKGWKLRLERSLPLILRGAESLARYAGSEPLGQAVFLLEKFGGKTVLEEDLAR